MTDLKLNPPKNKKDLTKDNMLAYVKEYGTAEDKVWFVELMNANKKKVLNHLTKEVVDSYDFKTVREAFAKRFFPAISTKEKKKPAKKEKKSFEDELAELLA